MILRPEPQPRNRCLRKFGIFSWTTSCHCIHQSNFDAPEAGLQHDLQGAVRLKNGSGRTGEHFPRSHAGAGGGASLPGRVPLSCPPASDSRLLGYRNPSRKLWRASAGSVFSERCEARQPSLLCGGLPPRLGFPAAAGVAHTPAAPDGPGSGGGRTLPSALLGNLYTSSPTLQGNYPSPLFPAPGSPEPLNSIFRARFPGP